MKLATLLLTLSSLLFSIHAADAPPVTLTVKSYNALTAAVSKVADAIKPGSGAMVVGVIQGGLGEIKGLDLDKPWQAAVWSVDMASRPAISVWIPTTDFAALKASFSASPLAAGLPPGGSDITQVENYASLFISGGKPSKEAMEGHAAWTPKALNDVDKAINLSVILTEPLRQQGLMGLSIGRMSATGAMTKSPAPGMDPKAMADMMGIYFGALETIVKGLRQLDIGLDLREEAVVYSYRFQATEGSDFFGWLKPSEGSLDGVLPYAGGDGSLKFAMRMGNHPDLLKEMKKFMRIAMTAQAQKVDEASITGLEQLMDSMMPMSVAGGLTFKPGPSMGGAYQFPGKDINAIHQLITQFYEKGMAGFAGPDKPYKAIQVEVGKRNVGGVSLNRLTMEMNLDSPLYKQPGQKEAIESMFPGGKLEFEYGVKDDKLLFASPSQMDALVAGPQAASAFPLPITPQTVICGQINLFSIMNSMSASNPALSPKTKIAFEAADLTGTEVGFRVELDGSLRAEQIAPLKFFQTFSKIVTK